jgi:hypothetical protein
LYEKGDVLVPLIFNFGLECAIRKVQENQVGLKSDGAHQLLVYLDDINLLGDSLRITKKAQKLLLRLVRCFV